MTYVPTAEELSSDQGQITELLTQLLARMERIEQKLESVEQVVEQAPGLVATAADVFDGLYHDASAHGINADERLKLGLLALERLTTPDNLRAISGLSAQLSTLNMLAQQAPGFAAMTVDMVDELYAAIGQQGVDLEATAKQGLVAFRNFVTLLQSNEVKALLDSGMLDPQTLQVMGAAANALVCTQREPRRAGPLELARALFDRNIQRTLGFALGFAERFGRNLPTFPERR
jgi:hypothetical protein